MDSPILHSLFQVILHRYPLSFLLDFVVYCSGSSPLPPYINPVHYKEEKQDLPAHLYHPYRSPHILSLSHHFLCFDSPSNNYTTDPDCSFTSETFGFVHLLSRSLIFETTKQIPSVRIYDSANPSAEHSFLLLERSQHYTGQGKWNGLCTPGH